MKQFLGFLSTVLILAFASLSFSVEASNNTASPVIRENSLTNQTLEMPYFQWAFSKMKWELIRYARNPGKQVRSGTFSVVTVVEYSDKSTHLLLGDTGAYVKEELEALALQSHESANTTKLRMLSSDPLFEGFCTLTYAKADLDDNAQLYRLKGPNWRFLRFFAASTDASWHAPTPTIDRFPGMRWETLTQGASGAEELYCLNFAPAKEQRGVREILNPLEPQGEKHGSVFCQDGKSTKKADCSRTPTITRITRYKRVR